MDTSENDVEQLIRELGGDVAAAEFWEISRQAVAKFRKEKHIPNARMLHLKAARPDLFGGPCAKHGESTCGSVELTV